MVDFPDPSASGAPSRSASSQDARASSRRVYLVRHGETEWSLSGRHTSRTDLPLTAEGERRAAQLASVFSRHPFALVLTSPMQRAVRTCELAGLLGNAEIVPELREWEYGDFEGRTTAEIRAERADWNLFHDGVPRGEIVEDVAARLKRVMTRIVAADGDVAVFGHGHALRVLATLWMGLAAEDAERLVLDAGSLSILGFERETRVIRMWNSRT